MESDALDRLFATRYSLFASRQAAYDAANEQIQFNNATPNLTYDANGNLTSQTDASGTTTYTWDARNRLTAIGGPGVSASFVYDALGRRVNKSINGVATQFLYDGKDTMQEIGGGAVGASYVRSLNIDKPFVRQSSTNEFYHADALGSSVALTNQAGAVPVSYSYEAFGKTTVTGTSTNSFQYTGRESDSSGLYYYRQRYYSSLLQRFLLQDPAGLDGGINFYAYVLNNPINRVDPWGLDPGQTFSTQQAAAIDALDYVCKNPDQFFPFYEWGNYIYLTPGGYTYDYPKDSRDPEYIDLGDPRTNRFNRAYFHTHTSTDDFSPDDRRIGFEQARAAGLTAAYMAGPGCAVIRCFDLQKNMGTRLR